MKFFPAFFAAAFVAVVSVNAEIDVYDSQLSDPGQAYLIGGWNFNGETGGSPDFGVSHGTGTLTTNWDASNIADFSGTTVNRFGGDVGGRDLALRNGVDAINEGRHLEFVISLASFEGLVVSYATQRSGTGFTDQEWWWSLDGEDFTYFETVNAPGSYARQTVDFSEVDALDLAETVYLRLVVTGQPESSAATGNNRFDNFQFRATAPAGAVGPGTAVLSNLTEDSAYRGTRAFASGGIQSVQLNVTAQEAEEIESLRISLPGDWAEGSFEEVELSGDGFESASGWREGPSAVIEGAGVVAGEPGSVVLHGVRFPEAAGEYGQFRFGMETAVAGEELERIGSLPHGQVVIPVAAIRPVDEGGVPLSLNETVAVAGVATVDSGNFHNERFSTYLQDDTAGVAIDHPSLLEMAPGAAAGNRYVAIGRVTQFRGLTRITLGEPEDFFLLGPGEMPEPQVRTVAELLAESEMLEGSLVRVARVTETGGGWPGQAEDGTLTITDDGGTHELKVFLSRFTDISWISEPEYPVDLVGVLGQFKTSPPYTTGFELLPRSSADFLPASEVDEGFEQWRRDFFADELEELAVSGIEADPTGDGVVNLLEYAFGGNPREDSRHLLPVAAWDEGHGEIQFRRVEAATDLVYRVEASDDLVEWTEIWSSANHPYEATEPVTEERVPVANPGGEGPVSRGFLRVVVTLESDE